jgi:hypothetical protein
MLGAYFGLSAVFDFPDILRKPSSEMLGIFSERRTLVVPFYYAFVLSQLAFVAVALLLYRALRGERSTLAFVATGFGVLAGFAQALGFLRWPFLVPRLAEVVSLPSSSLATRETAVLVFESFHTYAGVAVGENLFFWCESIWAILLGVFLVRDAVVTHLMAGVLLLIGAGILIYTLEQFGGSFAALGPLNVLAHGALLFWLLGLAWLLFNAQNAPTLPLRLSPVAAGILLAGYLAGVTPAFMPD